MSENSNEPKHYDVLGMKWGVRRYENKDGSLTEAGKKRYAKTGESGYHYHSHATKKYGKKADRAEKRGNVEKAQKFRRREQRSAAVDEREEEYARSKTVKEHLGSRMLTGGAGGGKSYAIRVGIKAAAKNKKISELTEDDKHRALARSVFSQYLGADSLGFHAGARHEKRKWVKQPEKEERKNRRKKIIY